MKKIIAVLLSFLMILSSNVFCLTAYAQDDEYYSDTYYSETDDSVYGLYHEDVSYFFNKKTGELTIKGSGEMSLRDVERYGLYEEGFYWRYSDCIAYGTKKLIIEDGITAIGVEAFYRFDNLETVIMPKSVKAIYSLAFASCNNIKDVYYGGTIVDWNHIEVDNPIDLDELSKGKIHYSKKVSAKELKYSLSRTSYVYDGKTHTPSVTVKDKYGRKLRKNTDYTVTIDKGRKSAGKYKVFIKFKGEYYGQKTMYFTINPKPTSISKLTAGKKKFTVKWKKKTSQTTGYQIQYSTSSKFKNTKTVTVSKNKTTSKTISKLKVRKKYYVRVRTYKTVKVNGKSTKIYSAWSKAKTVTTK